jgi:CO/xanthine dehydrogenase FAD-binding subunit
VKPAPFEYSAPDSVEAAVALLGEDVRVLAGGQSLLPLLNQRLARPARLVDVNGIRELAGLRRSGGALLIGATVRQAALERSTLVARHWPLLAQAVRYAGHAAVRSRGTVGGSVAQADPSAELPVALTALGARYHLRSPRGARVVSELFAGPFATAIAADELLTAIELPPLPPGARTAFAEYAPTHGSFADAGIAVVRAPGHAAIAVLGTGSHPVRAPEAERALREGAGASEAAELAAAVIEHPHRRALAAALAREAIEAAAPAGDSPASAGSGSAAAPGAGCSAAPAGAGCSGAPAGAGSPAAPAGDSEPGAP